MYCPARHTAHGIRLNLACKQLITETTLTINSSQETPCRRFYNVQPSIRPLGNQSDTLFRPRPPCQLHKVAAAPESISRHGTTQAWEMHVGRTLPLSMPRDFWKTGPRVNGMGSKLPSLPRKVPSTNTTTIHTLLTPRSMRTVMKKLAVIERRSRIFFDFG